MNQTASREFLGIVSERFFHSIVDTVREPLVVLDQKLRIRLANRAFYTTFRVTRGEIENRLIYEIGDNQWDIPALRMLLEDILPKQAALNDFEVEHFFPVIGRKIMLLNARQIVDDSNGSEPLILLAIEDVTERKRIQQLLKEERDRALKSQNELIAVVSHEIKNPLTTIATSVELISKTLLSDKDGRKTKKFLEQIRIAVNRITQITSDLLDFTRISFGILELRPRMVDTGKLLAEAVEMFQPLASRKALSLEWRVSPDSKVIRCDPERIVQVLSNLLSNAIKFTGSGGSVWIDVSRIRNQIRFQVKDTGPGIPADQLPHVFERFWQAKHTAYVGAGLGLYIAKNIIDGHGGEMGVEGKVGEGSTFFFTLLAPI